MKHSEMTRLSMDHKIKQGIDNKSFKMNLQSVGDTALLSEVCLFCDLGMNHPLMLGIRTTSTQASGCCKGLTDITTVGFWKVGFRSLPLMGLRPFWRDRCL